MDNKKDLSKDFDWTECQIKAIDEITRWSFDSSELFWGLTGAAGTGKSTVIKECLKFIKQKYRLITSAPTHKAKNIIGKFTGLDSKTIHSLLGLKPNMELDNFNINNVVFKQGGTSTIGKYRIIFLDEASMLNKDLFELLIATAKKYDVKILFIGDDVQLCPVGEKFSPALKKENLSGISELITPVRQEVSNPLTFLLRCLRYDIKPSDINRKLAIQAADFFIENAEEQINENCKTGLFNWIIFNHPVIMRGTKGYNFKNSYSELIDKAIEAFKSFEFITDKNYAKYIAYNNTFVEEANFEIRNTLHDTEKIIVEGDLLTGFTTIIDYATKNHILTNSEDYKVVKVYDEISEFGVNIIPIRIKTLDETSTSEINIVKEDSYAQFRELIFPLMENAKNKFGRERGVAWGKYYKVKDSKLLLHNLSKKFSNAPKNDIGYIFCSTVHKTQGSTYTNVYIDGKNIKDMYRQSLAAIQRGREITEKDKEDLKEQRLRLLYVSISRAKESAHVRI